MWKYQAWCFTKINKERAGDWTAGIPTWVEVSSKSGFFGWDLSNCDNCGWIEKQRQHSRYSGGFCLRNIIMLVEAGMELLSCDLSCLPSYPRSGQPEYLKEASLYLTHTQWAQSGPSGSGHLKTNDTQDLNGYHSIPLCLRKWDSQYSTIKAGWRKLIIIRRHWVNDIFWY